MRRRPPRLRPPTFLLALWLAPSVTGLKSVVDAVTLSRRQTAPERPVDLRVSVLRRAREQLAAAKEAAMESEVNSKSMLASQQQLLAMMAQDKAEDAAELDAGSVADAQEALAETRGFAIQAQLHAKHVKQLERALKKLPQEAADEAAAAIREELRTEAYTTATQAAARVAAEAPGKHAKKVMSSIAAAMEPYHLSLLRSQKQAAEDEAKARSAAVASVRLQAEAVKLAKRAQDMQSAGLTVQAGQTMSIAHETSEQSVGMRKWAEQLHVRAGQLQNSLTTLEGYEHQAAEHAAKSVGEEVVPCLPTRQPAAAV